MKLSRELLKQAGMQPKLRLMRKTENGTVSTGEHTVRLISDKEGVATDAQTGKDYPTIKYLVEENGELKVYETRKFDKKTGELNYLVKVLAEYPENSIVKMEAKKVGIKNYIQVLPVNTPKEAELPDDELDDMDN